MNGMNKKQFLAALPPEVRENFGSRIKFTPTCWLWTRALSKGYGRFYYAKKTHYAYRLAYEWTVGPVAEGMELDHVETRGCLHKNCVRPDHLEEVTPRVNTLRGNSVAAINARKTHCSRGHALTPQNLLKSRSGAITRRRCRLCGYARFKEGREKEGRPIQVANKDRTHCPQGHPLAGDNLEPYAKKKGHRLCLICWRASQRKWRQNNRRD